MNKPEYIGLAWVSTGDNIVWKLCEFPPFELAVAKDVNAKVVVDGLNGQEIDKLEDCRTVAKDTVEYRMIMDEAKLYGKVIGIVKEFEGA